MAAAAADEVEIDRRRHLFSAAEDAEIDLDCRRCRVRAVADKARIDRRRGKARRSGGGDFAAGGKFSRNGRYLNFGDTLVIRL